MPDPRLAAVSGMASTQITDCTRPLRKTVRMVNYHIPAPRVLKPGWDGSVSQPVDHEQHVRYQKVSFQMLGKLLSKKTNKTQASEEAGSADGCSVDKQILEVQPTFDLVATETNGGDGTRGSSLAIKR